jgi:hypothetical protein
MIFSCVGYEDLAPSKVVLDDGILSGNVMKDGKFVMSVCECLDRDWQFTDLYAIPRPDVQPGTYILSVQSHDHTFDSVSCLPRPIQQTTNI